MEEYPSSLVSQVVQDGVILTSRAGCSLREFLTEECRIPPEYIDTRISTIFLDGSPIDDIDSALIRDGSIVALSAAMPGLVGATMRRGGFYSSFRSSITHAESGESWRAGMVPVRLKLFNLIMDELGPGFLKRGVLVKCRDLARALARQPDDFWEKCRNLTVNGERIECQRLRRDHALFSGEMALLTIAVTGAAS
ncbi:hypothetical protein JXA88_18365 [Candidatus Fermentibacteria bacterium]|nr:hypothetical protein [Candidatus Fermentibacteria bacterium]